MTRKTLWRGLTAIFAILLVIIIVGTNIAVDNEGQINSYLETQSSRVVTPDDDDTDTEYYKSEYGERNASNLDELKEDLIEQGVQEMEEGAVLIWNEEVDNEGNLALPLASDERSVTLFGRNSTTISGVEDGVGGGFGTTTYAGPLYRGSSAGSTNGSEDHFVSYLDAFTNAGFDYNEELIDLYYTQPTRTKGSASDPYNVSIGEADISIYTDSVKNEWRGDDYDDVAIVLLVRDGGEDSELLTELTDAAGVRNEGRSQLALTAEEEDMLEMIQDEKEAGYFDKVVVIINSSWAMEVNWLDDYDVDAALVVGGAGDVGFEGVVNILTGAANPSGKLVDTYAYSSLSAPAVVNGNYNVEQWENYTQYNYNSTGGGAYDILDAETNTTYYNVQVEGIYVGYKYYETRYEDTILGGRGASASVGAYGSEDEWAWENEVSFPFGYGLSYTEFSQEITDISYSKDEVTVEVKVTNNGSMAGKDVIQIYAQTPYGEYEQTNNVEKSAIQLVAFDKTDVLAANGGTGTYTITFDTYLLASYDSSDGVEAYSLSQGNYYIAIGDSAHDALNNVLAAKGYSNAGLVDVGGDIVEGDASKVETWYWERDIDTFAYSEIVVESGTQTDGYTYTTERGARVENQFEDCDINYWLSSGAITSEVKYLTRSDWDDTYPTAVVQVNLTTDMAEILNSEFYETAEDADSVSDFTFGANNERTFVSMKDVPYDDDDAWNEYLDQFSSIEELAYQTGGLRAYVAAESVAKPEYDAGDGPDGGLYGTAYDAAGNEIGSLNFCFTNEVVLGSTFNPDLITRRGELIGEIGIWTNQPASFAPGGNVHRTPFSGRNHEYFSEDANFCYYANEWFAEGMNSKGVLAGIKHVTGNDQEAHREGLATFFTEQNLREGALRAEEGALRTGNSMMLMQSFNRLGLTFSSASTALCTNVLVEEWGFRGIQETDAVSSTGYKSHWASMIAAGTDTFCFDSSHSAATSLTNYIASNDDGDLLEMLRQSVKDVHYALSRSVLINGLSPASTIVSVTPWWKATLYAAIAVLSVLTAASVTMFVLTERKIIKKKEGDER